MNLNRFKNKAPVQLAAYVALVGALLFTNGRIAESTKKADQIVLQSQRAGCERTNDLRQQINAQNDSIVRQNNISGLVFQTVANFPGVNPVLDERLTRAVRDYRSLNQTLKKKLEIIDCDSAYPNVD